jgi:hypothetical protein
VDALVDEYWQVEDVVREERHHTTGGSVDASSYPVATRADEYANLSLGYEYKEGFKYECCAGREEGYYHVVDDNEMEEGAECDADELAKLGLDCCSMLYDDGHDAEEVKVVTSGPLLHLLAREQSNPSAITNKEEEGREEEGEEEGEEEKEECHWEQVKKAADDGNAVDQKAEVSWRNSNPSLDMMFHRAMLNE